MNKVQGGEHNCYDFFAGGWCKHLISLEQKHQTIPTLKKKENNIHTDTTVKSKFGELFLLLHLLKKGGVCICVRRM